MLHLIRKDFLLNKMVLLTPVIMLLYLFFMGFAKIDFSAAFIVSILVASVLPFIILLKEENYKGYKILCSMPLRKDKIIASKYISVWSFFSLALLIFCLMGITISFYIYHITPAIYFGNFTFYRFALSILIFSINVSVFMPFIIRYGKVELYIMGLIILNIAAMIITPMDRGHNRLSFIARFINEYLNSFNSFLTNLHQLHGFLGPVIFVTIILFSMNFLSYKFLCNLINSREF